MMMQKLYWFKQKKKGEMDFILMYVLPFILLVFFFCYVLHINYCSSQVHIIHMVLNTVATV